MGQLDSKIQKVTVASNNATAIQFLPLGFGRQWNPMLAWHKSVQGTRLVCLLIPMQ
jgi:hypothetical protein